ncbi:MAG: DUF2793 domain-containing protein, partial [Rhodobacteraceae bacterium]|nr:DUF2793 domain-containing protein [Paracoccaceae bacterium]
MSETYQFNLPLMQPSQAQKHVTFNEVTALLDAVAQVRLASLTLSAPPTVVVDGEAYNVASGATGDWAGQESMIAIASNGGWRFVTPRIGWRAWVEDVAGQYFFDGTGWVDDLVAFSPGGATLRNRIIEFDHDVVAGTFHNTLTSIPANAMAYGVTGRVIEAISADATATSWKLGVGGDNSRYGSGYGFSLNSYVHSVSGAPTTYY